MSSATRTLALLALAAAGCNNAPPEPPPLVGAVGVRVTRVAIYQGVERALVDHGSLVAPTVPLVAGRDALVRVFYQADGEYDGAEVVGRLTVDGGDPIEARGTVLGTSRQEALDSTVNFRVPGARIGAMMDFSVALLQPLREGGAANGAARFPAEGTTPIAVESKANTLRVVLAPFAYHADGSGRVPDTSPEQVETIRRRFLQLYPVSDVKVRVRAPYDWNGEIRPDGQGWQQVGFALYGFRADDGESADVYYYALFDPAASFNQYCRAGCLLGVTLLNDMPADEGNPMLRLALGVGFKDVAADTAAHEVGHAHGRSHAPCGQGIDPQSIDPDYPHAGAKIGAWGWDIAGGGLVPPTYTDIMSYCPMMWISDHNYAALSRRGQHVNAARYAAGAGRPVLHEMIAIDGTGVADWRSAVPVTQPLGGERVAVTVLDGAGAHAVAGHFYRYDHLPGGWLFVPAGDRAADARLLELTLDGRRITARR